MPDSPTAKSGSREPVLWPRMASLNPASPKVNDPKFREESFFDPRDIV